MSWMRPSAGCAAGDSAGLDRLAVWFDRALTAATVADIFQDDED